MVSRSLNKKFDKILAREEAGNLTSKTGNRSLRKMMNNRLAIVGLILFSIILFTAVFAPLITSADPMKINLRNMSQPPSWEHWFGTEGPLWRSGFNSCGSGERHHICNYWRSDWSLHWIQGWVAGCNRFACVRIIHVFPANHSGTAVGLDHRSKPDQSDDYFRSHRMGRYVSNGAGPNAFPPRGRIRASLAKLRSVNSSYLLQTYPAQCLGPDHGEHYAVDCSLYFGRGWPKLPGFRCACSHSDLGQYLKCRSGNPRFAELLVDVVTSRRGYFAFCSKC